MRKINCLTYLSIFFLIVVFYAPANAQITNKQLAGNWKLSALIDKQISNSELQKRYIFKQDSLIYTSPRRNVQGTFKLDEKTGKTNWFVTGTPQPVNLHLKFVSDSVIHLSELGGNSTVGILKRVKD